MTTETDIPGQQFRALILVLILFGIGALIRWLQP